MNLLQMSISGAIMILAVIVIRALAINRLPKKTFIALWVVVLLRLLAPFSLPSPFSVYSLVNNHVPMPQETVVLGHANPLPAMSDAPAVLPTAAEVLHSSPAANIPLYLIIWGIGMIICALFFAVSYIKCSREFRESLPVRNDFSAQWTIKHKLIRPVQIRQSCRISAPLTYGVFKPIILMPKETNWTDTKQIEYILAHEFVHIKRFDAAKKLLLTAALCVHWFNPLVWAMYILSNRDIELSCDETVVRSFGDTAKSAYARTLISMEEKKNSLTPLCNNFSKNAIEERITAIMKMKKTSLAAMLVAFLLVGSVTTVFATSAKAENDNAYEQGYPNADLTEQMNLPEEYGKFGISFDKNGKMLYSGKLIRYFWDGYVIDGYSTATHYEYLNESGVIDVHTTRTIIDNGDGSINPFGSLTGIVAYSQAEFDERDLSDFSASPEQITTAEGSSSGLGGMTFAEKFLRYKLYGIEYKEERVGSGFGNVYFNGELTKSFIDKTPNGGVFSYASKNRGTITVQTVYDSKGNLIGVEKQQNAPIIPVKTDNITFEQNRKSTAMLFKTTAREPVYAAQSGTVISEGYSLAATASGYQIQIKQEDGYLAVYSHLDWDKAKDIVTKGQKVNVGDLIGYTGDSGDAVGLQCAFWLIPGAKLDYNLSLGAEEIKQYFSIA